MTKQDPNETSQRSSISISRRQSREIQSGRQSAPPDISSNRPQFMFIDSGADPASSSEAVRVHVMRESHRARRSSRRGYQQLSPIDNMTILTRESSSETSRRVTPLSRSSEAELEKNRDEIGWDGVVSGGVPCSVLDDLNELERLADECHRRDNFRNPELRSLSRGNVISMNAYLALAAFRSSQESGNIASAQFETKALEILRSALADDERRRADSTIVTVFMLSMLEEEKGNQESALFHRDALHRLIHDWEGMEILMLQNSDLSEVLRNSDILHFGD